MYISRLSVILDQERPCVYTLWLYSIGTYMLSIIFYFFFGVQAVKAFCHFYRVSLAFRLSASSILVIPRLFKSLFILSSHRWRGLPLGLFPMGLYWIIPYIDNTTGRVEYAAALLYRFLLPYTFIHPFYNSGLNLVLRLNLVQIE